MISNHILRVRICMALEAQMLGRMSGENWRLVTDELRKNQLKLKTSRELPIILKESIENIPPMNEAKPEDVNM